MFKRKLIVAFITSVIIVIALNIYEPVPTEDGGWGLGMFVYSFYVVPIIYIYGMMSSMIADKIGYRASKYMEVTSFLLHVLFGISFIVPYSVFIEYDPFPGFTVMHILTHPVIVLGLICSILFYAIDRIVGRTLITK